MPNGNDSNKIKNVVQLKDKLFFGGRKCQKEFNKL